MRTNNKTTLQSKAKQRERQRRANSAIWLLPVLADSVLVEIRSDGVFDLSGPCGDAIDDAISAIHVVFGLSDVQIHSVESLCVVFVRINNQQSTINNQQSTINNQQSTINNQQPTINNQQSTINGGLKRKSREANRFGLEAFRWFEPEST